MTNLCIYKHILGIPKKGVHKMRIPVAELS